MMLHGGQFHVYYSRSKTTHIITNNLPNSKIQELKGEKVIKPEWITDRCVFRIIIIIIFLPNLILYGKILTTSSCLLSCVHTSIKAGRLLPYLQYQLYAKQKGPLFPGMTVRQTPEMAGPSQATLQPSVRQKRSAQHPVVNLERSASSCQNNSIPQPSHCPLYPGNIQPQSLQPSAAARFTNPQPGHTVSGHLSSDPKHRGHLHSYPLPKPSPTKHLHKPPQPPLQPQPQTNSSCSSGCKDVELKK